MEGPDLRPTFRVPLDLTREDAVERLRARLVARPELHGRWHGKGRWAEIGVPRDERKLWSPVLSLRVDKTRWGSELFGRFAPQPHVWTFFMFVYGAVAFLALLGAVLGYAQWASDEPTWGLRAVWFGVPFLMSLHGVSAVGKRLARSQMRSLHTLVFEVLEELSDEVEGADSDRTGADRPESDALAAEE